MKKSKDPFNTPETLFARLHTGCADDWHNYVNHRFVRGIADASLPETYFRNYLIQDYLFLVHFARAWALLIYKADNLADMRFAVKILDALINEEIELHVKYCAGWRISRQELDTAEEAVANLAYTRFVLDCGAAGDTLDLYVALMPCVVGYAVIGKHIIESPATKMAGNPYKDWIEMYSGDDYQSLAQEAVQHLDDLAASRLTPVRFQKLAQIFRKATQLETGFWEMGLNT
jgi:thiaminase/transcriptional activator TenA